MRLWKDAGRALGPDCRSPLTFTTGGATVGVAHRRSQEYLNNRGVVNGTVDTHYQREGVLEKLRMFTRAGKRRNLVGGGGEDGTPSW